MCSGQHCSHHNYWKLNRDAPGQSLLFRGGYSLLVSECVLRPLSAQISEDLDLFWLLDFDPAAQGVKNCWFNFGGSGCSPRIAGQGSYEELAS